MKTEFKLMQKSLFFLAFSCTLSSQIGWVQAQSLPNTKTFQISQKFKPKVDNKRNPATDGGATRGSSCVDKKDSLIALNPPNLIGLTVAKHPTLFWYQPDSTAQLINFTIGVYGENENLYETKLPISIKAGINSFTLPQNAPELKINRTYQWSITMVCDSEDYSGNVRITSFIERIEPDTVLLKNLKTANYRNLSNIYAQAGIWYEGINALIQQRCTEPNNLSVKTKWRQFLESGGLNGIVSKKLINACPINNR